MARNHKSANRHAGKIAQASAAERPHNNHPGAVPDLTAPMNPRTGLAELIHRHAFTVWLERGCGDGHPQEDLWQAEMEILAANKQAT